MSKQHLIPGQVWRCTLFIAAVVAFGCGEPGPANIVSGKVTVNGEPVVGFIHFVGADGKEVMAPVGPGGGVYNIVDPPQGEVTVLIKGGPVAGGPALTPAPGAIEMPSGTATGTGPGGVAAPAKYADPSTSGLKYTVQPGKHTKDFELTP